MNCEGVASLDHIAAAHRRWRAEEIRRSEYRRPKPRAGAQLPAKRKASKRRVRSYRPRPVPEWLRRAVEKAGDPTH